jgi:hypothetical protein
MPPFFLHKYSEEYSLVNMPDYPGPLYAPWSAVVAGRGFDPLEEMAPPGNKYKRMVKHIKKNYPKSQEGIAFATAWKHYNKKKMSEEFDYLFEDLDVTTLTEEDIIDLIEKKIPSSRRAKIARAVADRLPPGRTSSQLRLYALERDLEKQKGRKFTKADSRQGATSAPKNEMRTFQDFMAIIEAVDWDKSEIGHTTGGPVPKKKMSPAKRHEFEKKRRANLAKKPGDPAGDSTLVRALRRKAKESGNYAD